MFCDFVKCNNCETEGMKVRAGEEICPLCGAIGVLSWVDNENQEVEVSDSEILDIQPHIYHPGHDAYDAYQCSECGLLDVGYGEYTRKQSFIFNNKVKPEDINPRFIEEGDDGFLKFYNINENHSYYMTDNPVDYVELCPQGILENIVKLYGKDTEYEFDIRECEGPTLFRSVEYILNLNVSKDGKSFTYEIYSSNIEDELKEIKEQFFNQILN